MRTLFQSTYFTYFSAFKKHDFQFFWNGVSTSVCVLRFFFKITGSAVALHCCKAHSKIKKKIENSTPCKIVTPENFILKLGTRDYVENITHALTHHQRFSGGFSTNRWNKLQPFCDFFPVLSCPVVFFVPTPSSNRATYIRGQWAKWRGSAQGWSFLGLGRWVTSFGGNVPYPAPSPKRGAWIGLFKPN